MNKVILIGRLGKDPELRMTQTNMPVVNFSLATSSKYKGEEQTEWHNIVCFNKTAEIAEKYLNKGALVAIDGKIKTSSYEKDGRTIYRTDILCNSLDMLGSKDSSTNKDKPVEAKNGAQKVTNIDLSTIDDELPF